MKAVDAMVPTLLQTPQLWDHLVRREHHEVTEAEKGMDRHKGVNTMPE